MVFFRTLTFGLGPAWTCMNSKKTLFEVYLSNAESCSKPLPLSLSLYLPQSFIAVTLAACIC
jgi:hypothetical protein